MKRRELQPEITSPPRRGVALLMVLLLLSLTVGLCYAAMRSQFTAAAIQRNSDRTASARQTAITGMTMAIKKMHRNDWSGVGTSLSGSLGANESFTATFTAGDASLDSNDSDQPYRVSILSTGYAANPQRPESIASYRVRAVVRLIPRKLAAQPANWAAMQDYVVYQTKKYDTEIDIPCRFIGKVRLQDTLKLALHYPNDSDARSRYMSDLNKMRLAGGSDNRTFTGPVHLPFSAQESKYHTLLTSGLGATAVDTAAVENASDWVKPASPGSYRMYKGGPSYAIQTISYSLSETALQPDVQTNPLGLLYRDGSVSLYNNVNIKGTLFCKDEIRFRGTNVVVKPVDLPPLAGSTAPVQLAATCSQEATVEDGSGGKVYGLIAVFDDFRVNDGLDATAFSLWGKLIASRLYVEERTAWNSIAWSAYYNYFLLQLYWNPEDAVQYFPEFMSYFGYSPAPRIVFAAETSPATYHWSASYDPIFVPHPDDGGLRWDLLSWSEEQ